MDSGEAGLFPIGTTNKNKDVVANVVFVHGLGGHYQNTWQCRPEEPETLWPAWLYDDLNENASHPVNVWSLGYPAEAFRVLFFSKSREDSVPQRARSLMNILITHGLAERPILFVAHSLGGILVKQMLRGSVDARHQNGGFAKLALSTRLVLFLATPHTGSSMAKLAGQLLTAKDMLISGLVSTVNWLPLGPAWLPGSVIKALARRSVTRGPFTEALEYGDPYLEDLGLWYRDNAPELGIETKAYCENAASKGIAVVVNKESANPQVGEVIPLDADHLTICKPSERNAIYQQLEAPIRDVVKKCPIFRETHLAVLDVGKRFTHLNELHPEERMIATKKVIHPIEFRLGRTKPVDYKRSAAGASEFQVENWQEERASLSEYDLDRIILYVWYEYRGLPLEQRTLFLRQERERLKGPSVSLIPLYYSARMLDKHRKAANLIQSEKDDVKSILDYVEDLAIKFPVDTNRQTRDQLAALLT